MDAECFLTKYFSNDEAGPSSRGRVYCTNCHAYREYFCKLACHFIIVSLDLLENVSVKLLAKHFLN